MTDDPAQPIVSHLERARRQLLALLVSLEDEAWETAVFASDSGADWSVTDLLRHLTDAERGMTRLMMRIREGSEGVPPDFDLARWNARVVEKSRHKPPGELLAEMTANRETLLDFLRSLAPDDWTRQGRHGSLRIMTIAQISRQIADHEIEHLEHLRRALGRDAPWHE